MSDINKMKNGNEKSVIKYFTLFIVLAGLFYGGYWLIRGRYSIETEDAYVGGNKVLVQPQIEGKITAIYADEMQLVDQGQLLVSLDKTDFQLKLDLTEKELALAVRNTAALFKKAEEIEASIEAQKAIVFQLDDLYQNRRLLRDSGGISSEEYINALSHLQSGKAELVAREKELENILSLISGTSPKTHPAVLKAAEEVKKAWIDLFRTDVYAPVSGLVAMREGQVGGSVSPERPFMTIVPIDELWVDANFKESKLRYIKLGQPVELTADLYGKRVPFQGKVVGIGAGTGAAFSLLPPQNASGNWIKIVQRLPVRIALKKEELRRHPLRVGLSMQAKVNVYDRLGGVIPNPSDEEVLFHTSVFKMDEHHIEKKISSIITDNLVVHLKND